MNLWHTNGFVEPATVSSDFQDPPRICRTMDAADLATVVPPIQNKTQKKNTEHWHPKPASHFAPYRTVFFEIICNG